MPIGIDIGGTKVQAGIVDKKGRILNEAIVKIELSKGKDYFLRQIRDLVKSLEPDCKGSVGVGCAGIIDINSGVIIKSPNLSILTGVNLKEELQGALGTKILIDNDARCFTLAEQRFGAAKGAKFAVGLTLGTGVGSGIVMNGKLFYGSQGVTEIGHTTIEFDGHPCSCGNIGCLEQYASGSAILRRTLRHIDTGYVKTKMKKPDLDAKEVQIFALNGDPLAVKIMEDTGKYLGIGISNILNLLNPEVVVIGGSVANAYGLFKERMFEEIEKRALYPAKKAPVVKAKLKSAGVIGASLLVE